MKHRLTDFSKTSRMFCAGCILFAHLGWSGTVQRIQQDAASGKLSATEGLVLEMLSVHAPDRLPEPYRSDTPEPVKCGFGLRARMHQQWGRFSDEQRAMLRPYVMRPSLPENVVSPRGLFKIHYTNTGIDAVPQNDENLNGVPDFVEEAARALDQSYHVQVEQMGFREPPRDEVYGPEYDVYMKQYNGYGETVLGAPVSHNPTTYTAYIVMDNDFQEVYSKGLDGLRVTCAHEFFHMIQLGYQFRNNDIFLMEAAATWMEDQVYNDINDYIQYLDKFLSRENVAINRSDGWHEYGLSIWFHFLQKRMSRNIVKAVWEQIVHVPALNAMDQVLQTHDTSLQSELATFYGWNILTGTRADTLNYYPEGHLYPEISANFHHVISDTSKDFTVFGSAARHFSTSFFDGNSVIWSVVNTRWEHAASSRSCMLMITRGQTYPFWDAVTDGINASLLSENGNGWRYNAVVIHPDGNLQLKQFDEQDESRFGAVTGHVFHVQPLASGDTLILKGLNGVSVRCVGAGEDGLFDTDDDIRIPTKVTSDEGEYVFLGLPEGVYRINVDPSTVNDGYVPASPAFEKEIEITAGTRIFDLQFPYRYLSEASLPSAIPNPYIPTTWPEIKIPFALHEFGFIQCVIYSSNGLKVHEMSDYFNETGVRFFRWDARNDHGLVAGGIYLYVITQEAQMIRRDKFAIVH